MSRWTDRRRNSSKGPQNVRAQILHQGNCTLCVEVLVAGECAKGDNRIGLVGRPYGNAVMEAKALCGGDEAPILLGRQTLIDLSPMVRTGGAQRGLEYWVELRQTMIAI